MIRETIADERLTPPIVRDIVSSLYENGLINLSCTLFERVGFNEEVASAISRGRAAPQQAEILGDPVDSFLTRKELHPPRVISSSSLKRKRSDSATLGESLS